MIVLFICFNIPSDRRCTYRRWLEVSSQIIVYLYRNSKSVYLIYCSGLAYYMLQDTCICYWLLIVIQCTCLSWNHNVVFYIFLLWNSFYAWYVWNLQRFSNMDVLLSEISWTCQRFLQGSKSKAITKASVKVSHKFISGFYVLTVNAINISV